MAHTPGPWFANDNGHYWEISCGDGASGQTVGDACASNTMYGPFEGPDGNPTNNGEANARLMAAAPDLLAALNLLEAEGHTMDVFRAARAAIAKAEGK
jgi:hypothetical protein